MTQREFERKIKKLVPSITRITYGKMLEGKNFIYSEVYIHTSTPHVIVGVDRKMCHLRIGKNCMERMIKMFEVQNESIN